MKIRCPACKTVSEINIGQLMGEIKSLAKAKASRENGKLGGAGKHKKNLNKNKNETN